MITAPTPQPIALAPVRPNAGLQQLYRRRLEHLIDEMHADIAAALRRTYMANQPEMASDAGLPATVLRAELRRLARRWGRRFDQAAPELAAYFATSATARADGQLAAILKKAGFAVAFTMTPTVRDIVQAGIGENVSLIRSIPSQHFTQIEGAVMRSVAAGRDLASLSINLQREYGVTRRRAALIARDQNNKATAIIARARQKELGITQAIWLHSAGGKQPRPGHVAYSGKPYDINRGAFIDNEWIWPGELINCRCVSRPVVPGLT